MNVNEDNKISVTLTPYQWHNLLEELEDRLCVVNIPRKNLVEVYEAIAGQLRGGPVKVVLNYPEKKEEKKKEDKKRSVQKTVLGWLRANE